MLKAMRVRTVLIAFVALAVLGGASSVTASAVPKPAPSPQFVLSPEGNHLWAYDATTTQAQLVVRAVNGDDPGATAPPNSDRRDINGQVCVTPDQKHIITGEDTVLNGTGGEGSHDPRIAGWGYHRILGSTLGKIAIKQEGKLAPEGGRGPGYTGDPDNFGCGFLDPSRLLTTAIGNTLPGETANGQLFFWFGPFTDGYQQVTLPDGTGFFSGSVAHCEIDHTLATAGGIAIDKNGDVYVAANRPDDESHPGGVWKYSGVWPTTAAQCTPEYVAANITKTLLIPAIQAPGVPLPDPRVLTPSAVVISPQNTLYVSSVFTGTVSEFGKDGHWIRDIYPTSPVAPFTGPTGQTPFGLAFTGDGSLWIADLGVVGSDAATDEGSVIRVTFDAAGNPTPFGQTVKDKLNFPDGLGVYTPAK
jgi:hypothetical protein